MRLIIFSLPSSFQQWGVLLELLPEDERSRVNKFMRENDRRLALGSRLLQRAVVSKVSSLLAHSFPFDPHSPVNEKRIMVMYL